MKKKSFLMSICFVLVAFFLASCGFTTLSEMPTLDANVSSNGGQTVVKGEYLYFVDSYLDITTLTKTDNEYGKVENCAIYRTKLVDGELELNDEGVLDSYELVVPKVVGTKNTNLFIYDNFIYYGSPNMQYDTAGTLRTDLIDFCKAKLDGSGVEVIYTTTNYGDSATHTFCKIEGSVYLVLFDGTDIIKVEMTTFTKSPVTLVEDVASAMLPTSTDYEYTVNYAISGMEGYVYYVRSLTDDDGFFDTSDRGNVLGRVNIKTGTKNELIDGATTYELMDIKSGNLYIYKTINENKTLWAKNNQNWLSGGVQITGTSVYTTVVVLDNVDGVNRGVIITYQDKTIWLKSADPIGNSELLLDSAITVKYTKGDYIYYLDSTSIYRLSLTTKETELVVSDSTMDTNYFDFGEDGYIYYFATYTGDSSESGIYLNRVNLSDKLLPEDPTDEEAETDLGYGIQLVGVLDSEHIATEEDEE